MHPPTPGPPAPETPALDYTPGTSTIELCEAASAGNLQAVQTTTSEPRSTPKMPLGSLPSTARSNMATSKSRVTSYPTVQIPLRLLYNLGGHPHPASRHSGPRCRDGAHPARPRCLYRTSDGAVRFDTAPSCCGYWACGSGEASPPKGSQSQG
jgi:hypothetical protein